MKAKFTKPIFTAALALATALTLSCSSSDDNGNDNNPVAALSSSNETYVSSSSSLYTGKSSSSVTADASSSSVYGNSSSSSEQGRSSSSSSVLSSSSQNAGVSSSSEQGRNSSSSGQSGIDCIALNNNMAVTEAGNSVKIVGINNYTGSVEVVLAPCEPPAGIPPTITTASLPPATVGNAYSKTLTATGDTPISWSIKSGNLPAGLSLSGNTISGTPTAAGTFNIVVKATNAAGSDEKNFSIIVSAAVIEPGEGLMYMGHAANNDLAIIIEWFDWHINEGLIESSLITGTVKEIQFPAGSGYRVILIPQSAGVPARMDDAGGINVKEAAFIPVSNITVKGIPYYLFISGVRVTDTAPGFMLTIKW